MEAQGLGWEGGDWPGTASTARTRPPDCPEKRVSQEDEEGGHREGGRF